MVSSGRHNPDFDSVLGVPIQELVIDKDLQNHEGTLLFTALIIGIAIKTIRSDMIFKKSIFII